MNKNNIFKYSTIFLLLLNLALIGFIIFSKPKPPRLRDDNFKERIVSILKLDEDQNKEFSNLAMTHNQEINAINSEQQKLAHDYFNSVIKESDGEDSAEILKQLAQLENKKLTVTADHFHDVKNILRSDQLDQYPAFVDQVLGVLLMGNNKGPKPRNDR
ncbi:hypothetical protein [Membranihabitans marinus]|uniref:hypothetical protein n=1 Tax=Membranihabitans marinus TaxID=1227546 RepID=UPI001F3BFB93|nr:hypothetical protein [Membranihabitans marinus]